VVENKEVPDRNIGVVPDRNIDGVPPVRKYVNYRTLYLYTETSKKYFSSHVLSYKRTFFPLVT
jgi:hypothetical protein